jgi:putative oxidoreductase
MNAQLDGVALIGRLALALAFVTSGFGKITGFAGTVGYIASKGVPLPEVAAALGVLIELGGGLAIMAGWMTRWISLALIVFLIVITPIFHAFWSVPGAEAGIERIMFMKNLSILGGFLLLLAFGPGRYSIDKK